MKVASGPLAGQTVQQVLALANSVLGGGALPSGMTICAAQRHRRQDQQQL